MAAKPKNTVKKTTKKKTTAKKTTARAKKKPSSWTSRAVKRLIEPGSATDCLECGERISYKARERNMQVICNIYDNNAWLRVEHFHDKCYTKASKPYGKAARKS